MAAVAAVVAAVAVEDAGSPPPKRTSLNRSIKKPAFKGPVFFFRGNPSYFISKSSINLVV